MSSIPAPSPATTSTPERGSWYPWYVTAVLMVAYTFSFLDRKIVDLMIGPIRRDLGISDHEFGLLVGAAFGLFYTLMGLPLGWLADRYPRKRIIAIGIAAWSVMTAAGGLAKNFWQLFLARMGVGVGEATLSPSTYSMLADSFDKERLPRAMSLYTTGLFIGAGLALIVGGQVISHVETMPPVTLPLIGQVFSWQLVFIIVGMPGLLVALWVLDAHRTDAQRARPITCRSASCFVSWASIGSCSSHSSSAPAATPCSAMPTSWYPELFIRTWGWDAAEAGRINGLSSLIAGSARIAVRRLVRRTSDETRPQRRVLAVDCLRCGRHRDPRDRHAADAESVGHGRAVVSFSSSSSASHRC